MLFRVLIAAFTAAQLASAGLLSRRAPLGVAKIVEELTNVSGRDFCVAYIGAPILTLPEYSTIYTTKTIFKVSNTKSTTTTTEVIGTLKKGTVTTTLTSTVATGTASTFNEASVSTTTSTTVITTTHTYTDTFYSTPTAGSPPLSRRTEVVVPDALADSDPLSISAACTKVVNKFPVYTTSTGLTTKSATTTVSTTSVQVITKTQKSTHIEPYSVKTITTVATVAGGTVTVSSPSIVTETVTSTYTDGVYTATTVGICDPSYMPRATPILRSFQISETDNSLTFQERVQYFTIEQCCMYCYAGIAPGVSCLGYHFFADDGGVYGKCHTQEKQYEAVDSCPLATIGLLMNQNSEYPYTSQWRRGPCYRRNWQCTVPDGPDAENTCRQTYKPPKHH